MHNACTPRIIDLELRHIPRLYSGATRLYSRPQMSPTPSLIEECLSAQSFHAPDIASPVPTCPPRAAHCPPVAHLPNLCHQPQHSTIQVPGEVASWTLSNPLVNVTERPALGPFVSPAHPRITGQAPCLTPPPPPSPPPCTRARHPMAAGAGRGAVETNGGVEMWSPSGEAAIICGVRGLPEQSFGFGPD
jgi:hypothetical protein